MTFLRQRNGEPSPVSVQAIIISLLLGLNFVGCQSPGGASTPSRHVFPTSRPELATIHGILVLVNPITVIPEQNGVYLVAVEQQVTDDSTIANLGLDQLPRAEVDETSGEFVVPNVKPGSYLVMVVAQGNRRLLARKMESQEVVIVAVNGSDLNRTVEIGMARIP